MNTRTLMTRQLTVTPTGALHVQLVPGVTAQKREARESGIDHRGVLIRRGLRDIHVVILPIGQPQPGLLRLLPSPTTRAARP